MKSEFETIYSDDDYNNSSPEAVENVYLESEVGGDDIYAEFFRRQRTILEGATDEDSRMLVSMHTPLVQDSITDPDSFTEDEIIEAIDFREFLEILSFLTQVQRKVIEMHFGLGNEDKKTYEEAGQVLGISKCRIRQIEAIALRRMGNVFGDHYPHNLNSALRKFKKIRISDRIIEVSPDVLREAQAIRKKQKLSESVPPTLSDLEEVYSFIPDAHNDLFVRSLEPKTFEFVCGFSREQKQWIYSLALFSSNNYKLKRYLANSIFKCSILSIAVVFSHPFGKVALKSRAIDGEIWQSIVYAGLEEKVSELLLPVEEEQVRLEKEQKKLNERLSVVYSFIPDNWDAEFTYHSEGSFRWHKSKGITDGKRWIYTLFLLGPKDEEGKQGLIQYLADNVFNCPISDIAKIADCLTNEGRERFGKKKRWKDQYFVEHGIPSIERRYKKEKAERGFE